MGIFTNSTLYYGRLLSLRGYTRLECAGLLSEAKDYITPICKNYWLLHAPHRIIKIGGFLPLLSHDEVGRAYVKKGEITHIVSKHYAKEWELWNAMTPEESKKLEHYVKIAAWNIKDKPHTYVCETLWTTLVDNDGGTPTWNVIVD